MPTNKAPNGNARITIKKNKEIVRDVVHQFTPEELMRFELLATTKDDPGATLSQSITVGDMTYGNGVTIQLFTSITCMQEQEMMATGHRLLMEFNKDMLRESAVVADELKREIFGN